MGDTLLESTGRSMAGEVYRMRHPSGPRPGAGWFISSPPGSAAGVRVRRGEYVYHISKSRDGVFGIFNRLIHISVFDSIPDTVLDMALQNDLAYLVER